MTAYEYSLKLGMLGAESVRALLQEANNMVDIRRAQLHNATDGDAEG
jgi:hypothetical protein